MEISHRGSCVFQFALYFRLNSENVLHTHFNQTAKFRPKHKIAMCSGYEPNKYVLSMSSLNSFLIVLIKLSPLPKNYIIFVKNYDPIKYTQETNGKQVTYYFHHMLGKINLLVFRYQQKKNYIINLIQSDHCSNGKTNVRKLFMDIIKILNVGTYQ